MKQYTRKVSKGKKLFNPFREKKMCDADYRDLFILGNTPNQETDNC